MSTNHELDHKDRKRRNLIDAQVVEAMSRMPSYVHRCQVMVDVRSSSPTPKGVSSLEVYGALREKLSLSWMRQTIVRWLSDKNEADEGLVADFTKEAKPKFPMPPKPQIETESGGFFDFADPSKSEFTIQDIARGLSHICRFTGQVKSFYSVAQHSVLVSYLVPPEYAMEGLLHDGAEAFIGDVSTPLKMLLPDYQKIERNVEKELEIRFELSPLAYDAVKVGDRIALKTEKQCLTSGPMWTYLSDVDALKEDIVPLRPDEARKLFLDRYEELVELNAEISRQRDANQRQAA